MWNKTLLFYRINCKWRASTSTATHSSLFDSFRRTCTDHCNSWLSLFFTSSAFDPLRGNSRSWNFVCPGSYACATRGGVAMRSWPLLLPTFVLSSFLAQAALRAPPEVVLQCVAGHCYYQLSVFFLPFPSFAFDPLRGISRVWKFVPSWENCPYVGGGHLRGTDLEKVRDVPWILNYDLRTFHNNSH